MMELLSALLCGRQCPHKSSIDPVRLQSILAGEEEEGTRAAHDVLLGRAEEILGLPEREARTDKYFDLVAALQDAVVERFDDTIPEEDRREVVKAVTAAITRFESLSTKTCHAFALRQVGVDSMTAIANELGLKHELVDLPAAGGAFQRSWVLGTSEAISELREQAALMPR